MMAARTASSCCCCCGCCPTLDPGSNINLRKLPNNAAHLATFSTHLVHANPRCCCHACTFVCGTSSDFASLVSKSGSCCSLAGAQKPGQGSAILPWHTAFAYYLLDCQGEQVIHSPTEYGCAVGRSSGREARGCMAGCWTVSIPYARLLLLPCRTCCGLGCATGCCWTACCNPHIYPISSLPRRF